MKIDFNSTPQAAASGPDRNQQGRATFDTSSSGQIQAAQDKAQLSGTHVQVQALAVQTGQLPEIRQERIESLRRVIQSGEYHVGPDKIARAMADHMIYRPAA